MTMPTWLRVGFWTLLSAPGVWQIALLVWAVAARFPYPYDLEWMEGGVLHGAARIASGDGIYGQPSVDYISFLYTPLYPGLLALLGSVVGLSYQLGRLVSILSLVGLAALAVTNALAWSPRHRGAAVAGSVLGLGLFAAAYPFMEGWYDLVRADTMFLFIATGGLIGLSRWARADEGFRGHRRIAVAGLILGLAFFAKQTGVLYVLAGGPIIAVMNWRRAPTYVAAAGVMGLGGAALLQRTTGGWFWTYAFEIHQAHDWNKDRFYKSFELILMHFRWATAIIVLGLCVVLACAIVRRRLPPPARALLLWTYVYAVSTLIGAIGWGTEFAHYNAYMPAFLHGAMAAGLAVPAILACGELLLSGDRAPSERAADRARTLAHLGAAVVALGLGVQLYQARWNPRPFIPTARDRAAGDELIATIRALPGRVWVPSHPWYAHLAGKPMYVHRMGVKDVTARKPRPVMGLEEALRGREFAAIVFDNRDLFLEVPAIAHYYRPDDLVARTARPRLFTGAKIVPDSIWVPAGPAQLPTGWRVLFDFESGSYASWTVMGSAWGNAPERKEVAGQGLVRRFGGRHFATSMHGGDGRTGTLISAEFTIDADTIRMRLGGGAEDSGLRVELRIGGKAVRTATAPMPPSERFVDVSWSVADLIGQAATIALVDESERSWGHLNVDEIWIGPAE
ncbi:MAG: DUF2029 domain-containing protein [Myxococcales bacterium]|nr:DUF2029 domain-containing protein [Myxococcales bacterium]